MSADPSGAPESTRTDRIVRPGDCVERARHGERSALDEVVRELNPLLWHVARAEGLGREDAADVVQTVWLELVRRLEEIRSPQAVTGWLVTAARREAWRVRRRTRRQTADGITALEATPDPGAAGDAAGRPEVEGVVVTDPAGARLDEDDQAILDRLAALVGRVDPPPADLDERTRFAIALADIDVEVARLSDDLLTGSGARAAERTRTITFEADSRTIMVTVSDTPDGRVRLDGWLAPAVAVPVELRLGPVPGAGTYIATRAKTVTSDGTGRFVFDDVPHGLAQLRVGRPSDGARVVTPSLVL